jgi:hypothetical protein
MHGRFTAGAATAAAVLAVPLGATAAASATPSAAPETTTVFQVPVTFVAVCSTVGFICWVPHELAVVTPSAATGAPGAVTFSATGPATGDCIDVSVNWRNLTTGAAGNAVLRAVRPAYAGRPIPRDESCRYVPVTVVSGRGTVVAIADVNASVVPGSGSNWPQVPVNPGVGVFTVP